MAKKKQQQRQELRVRCWDLHAGDILIVGAVKARFKLCEVTQYDTTVNYVYKDHGEFVRRSKDQNDIVRVRR